jgi:hypothetical protein
MAVGVGAPLCVDRPKLLLSYERAAFTGPAWKCSQGSLELGAYLRSSPFSKPLSAQVRGDDRTTQVNFALGVLIGMRRDKKGHCGASSGEDGSHLQPNV